MNHNKTKKILFTGYAPVHFICFRPLYEFFMREPGYEVYVSGGLRTKVKNGTEKYSYNEYGMYWPLGVPRERILFVQEMREMDFDILFAANTKLITPRNVGTRIQIFHGISFRNKAIRKENMSCDYYFIVGPYMHRRFIETGLLAENDPRALKIGFPKTDPLLNGALKREELLEQYGLDGSRPVLLYAPTGQNNNSLETMGGEVIKRLTQTGKYDLLIKLHDHPKNDSINWFARLAVLEDKHTQVIRDRDVIPLLYLADLLITDASSVSSEYSLLDRPMIFLNVPKLLEKVSAAENSMVDLQTWGQKGGILVDRPEDIVDAVSESFANPDRHSDIRRAMAEDLFYNPGQATETAIQWLSDCFTPATSTAA
jgi:hypothetical protein